MKVEDVCPQTFSALTYLYTARRECHTDKKRNKSMMGDVCGWAGGGLRWREGVNNVVLITHTHAVSKGYFT